MESTIVPVVGAKAAFRFCFDGSVGLGMSYMASFSCGAACGQESARVGGRRGDVGPGADLRSQASADANDDATTEAMSDCKDNMIL